jgi:hypothetical protein
MIASSSRRMVSSTTPLLLFEYILQFLSEGRIVSIMFDVCSFFLECHQNHIQQPGHDLELAVESSNLFLCSSFRSPKNLKQ